MPQSPDDVEDDPRNADPEHENPLHNEPLHLVSSYHLSKTSQSLILVPGGMHSYLKFEETFE